MVVVRQYELKVALPVSESETTNDVFHFVNECVNEVNIDVPDIAIDRAHCLGKAYTYDLSGKLCQSIILRFVSF